LKRRIAKEINKNGKESEVCVCVLPRKIYSRVFIPTAAISYIFAASSILLLIQPPGLLYCRMREPQASLFFAGAPAVLN